MASEKSEFHCPFGPSQLRRLGPKRPRNTSKNGALPRASRAFGAACRVPGMGENDPPLPYNLRIRGGLGTH